MRLATLLILLTLPARATTMLYLSAVGPSEPQIYVGQPFGISVGIGTDRPVIAVDFDLVGPVVVLSQDNSNGPLSEVFASDPTAMGVDLGSISPTLSPFTGFSLISTLTVAVAPGTAPGEYALSLAPVGPGIGFTNASFGDNAFDALGSMTVRVVSVPEPAAFVVWFLIGVLLMLRVHV